MSISVLVELKLLLDLLLRLVVSVSLLLFYPVCFFVCFFSIVRSAFVSFLPFYSLYYFTVLVRVKKIVESI